MNSKKGFGSVTAVLVIPALLLVFYVANMQFAYQYEKDVFADHERVFSMSRFVFNLEEDSERALEIAAYRGLLGANEYIELTSGDFLPDVDESFRDVVLNGTINGTSLSISDDSTFLLWTRKIGVEALKENMNLTFDDNFTLTVKMISYREVKFELNGSYVLSDISGIAEFTKNLSVSSVIDISSFNDPFYTVGCNGVYFNPVTFADDFNISVGDVFDPSTNDTSVLASAVENKYYFTNNDSPDYLQRLVGSHNASSIYGIESFADLDVMQGICEFSGRSVIDKNYFDTSSQTIYGIDGMPSWFVLDQETIDYYNLEQVKI